MYNYNGHTKVIIVRDVLVSSLFHLIVCGLFDFDLNSGELLEFQAHMNEWRMDPQCGNKSYATYGRFHFVEHHVQLLPLKFHFKDEHLSHIKSFPFGSSGCHCDYACKYLA